MVSNGYFKLRSKYLIHPSQGIFTFTDYNRASISEAWANVLILREELGDPKSVVAVYGIPVHGPWAAIAEKIGGELC